MHTISRTPRWAVWLTWLWRGVTPETYRQTCRRCGQTGQAHVSGVACWRFQAPRALGQ